MSRTYTCDMCGENTKKGVTMASTPRLTDNLVSMAADSDAVINHVCLDCYPDEKGAKSLLTRLLELVR